MDLESLLDVGSWGLFPLAVVLVLVLIWKLWGTRWGTR